MARGKLPTFEQADINGDHYVTKSELKNFPYLLQVFDKVDAGHDGKLEQHEYQNLEMETKREGEVK
jgi:EF hand